MLDRRQFLKLGGATAFATLFGGCDKVQRRLIPFVIPPENYTLGEALWYASVCGQCPAGCGVVVRVSEGRAKKIEGNPLHPVNRGKLCARGQAALQALYHPERLSRPMKLSGARGSGAYTPISWEEALSLLMGQLKKAKAEAPPSLLMLTEPMRGHAGLVAGRFMKAFGSTHRVAWDPLGPDAMLSAHAAVYGVRDLPEHDLANARYLLSFSGDFLETGISPVHYAREYGRMRGDRETIRGKFVHFGPRLSMTAAAADLFLPCAPGTEGIVALGIAHVMVRDRLTAASSAARRLSDDLGAWSPEEVEKKTGVHAHDIAAVAEEFSRNQPGLAIAGTGTATGPDGAFHCAAAALLNVLAGNVGTPGGVSFPNRAQAFAKYGAEAPCSPRPRRAATRVCAPHSKKCAPARSGWRSSRGRRTPPSPSRLRSDSTKRCRRSPSSSPSPPSSTKHRRWPTSCFPSRRPSRHGGTTSPPWGTQGRSPSASRWWNRSTTPGRCPTS